MVWFCFVNGACEGNFNIIGGLLVVGGYVCNF